MLTIVYYFLQVMLCSGLLMAYYLLVLRNKRFHQYNRFYLLAAALLSCIVPLVKIQWSHPAVQQDPQMVRLLSVVANSNSQIDASLVDAGYRWSWGTAGIVLYSLVSVILLMGMIMALYRIYHLLKHHSCKNVEDVYLVLTRAKGTPFSFFKYIFWNEDIDIRSEAGKKILQHELTHVRQKHSFDKIFIQCLLMLYWFNPFFWLIKKEMEMIHEFIADRKAVEDGDTATLAQMLLTAAYPQQQFSLSNPFFFSPIKRRLAMLTNNVHPRFSYLRRLIVLPLLAILVILVSFRNKEQRANAPLSVSGLVKNIFQGVTRKDTGKPRISAGDNIVVTDIPLLSKEYTLVLDAGHGGNDMGATAGDGTNEAALALQIVKKIKELNENPKLTIILRREGDVFESAKDIVEKVNRLHPDMFVSIHLNTEPSNKRSGYDFFIGAKEKAFDYNASRLLASSLSGSLEKLNQPMLGIKTRDKGIYVVDAVKSPAVLIEAGYLSNTNDLAKLKEDSYITEVANQVLNGVNEYLINKEKIVAAIESPEQNRIKIGQNWRDTTIAMMNVTYPNMNKMRIDDMSLSASKININGGVQALTNASKYPLIIIDGVIKGNDRDLLDEIAVDCILEISVLKNELYTKEYGEAGKNGVIMITTKSGIIWGPSFPGGRIAWEKYLQRSLNLETIKSNGAPPGAYKVNVQFNVDEEGDISHVEAQNDGGYGIHTEAMRVISNGPRWKPLIKDGRALSSIRNVSIYFTIKASDAKLDPAKIEPN